jgi:hypothetical protein
LPSDDAFVRRWCAAVVVLVAVVSVGLQPAARATTTDEARLYQLTNGSRAQAGLPPLAYDDLASAVARAWANELAASGDLRHNPNLAVQTDAQVTTQWTLIGENVGYAGNIDEMHAAYMDSPRHRDNILGDFNRVGIGAVRDGRNRLWTTVVLVNGPPLAAVPSFAFAPFANARAMASQQFVDLLGRGPDAGGLDSWTRSLESGSATPAGMVASLLESPESASLVEPVNRLYWAYFFRAPDVGGSQYWIGRLRGGATLGTVSAAFAASSEFQAMYGALRDDQFVDLVYRNVLGREGDLTGKLYWVALLTAHQLDRGGVMLNFTESIEFRAASHTWNTIIEAYLGLLRRQPEAVALTYWSNELRNGRPVGDLAATLLASGEYRSRFGG